MTQHSLYIVQTTDGAQHDLTHAKELRSNNLYPFGLHNYAIYRTPEGTYIKATNSGHLHRMLDQYEVVEAATAEQYEHPYQRQED